MQQREGCNAPGSRRRFLGASFAVTALAVAGTGTLSGIASKNYAFVDAVARKNVELTIDNIRKDSPLLAGMESSGAIKIAGAMYNLHSGVVDFFGG